MKIKKLRFIEMVGSQGFLIPVQHTKERSEPGLEVGREYDLEITPHKQEVRQ